MCREHPSHLAWLMWWFLLQNIWTSIEFGWQSILRRVGYTGRGSFWKFCALQLFRVCRWGSVVDDELYYQGCVIIKAPISGAGGKWKVLYLRLLQLTFSVDRVQSETWPGVAYASHQVINGSLRCLPFLLGLGLFYPELTKKYHNYAISFEMSLSGHSTNLFRFSYIS